MNDHSYHRDKINFMAGAIVGAAAGAVVALLYAPRSGKETRAKLKEGAEKAVDDVKGAINTFEQEKVKPALENVKKDLDKKVTQFKKEMEKKLQTSKKKKSGGKKK
ncbi:YtxH domain-containing protein [Candidatus Dojkabacteria bacterium]|nr:YtxH domain-containing protein [Candidatus Dojkabacteria bacterium]